MVDRKAACLVDKSDNMMVAVLDEWMVDCWEVYWDVYWADRKVIDLLVVELVMTMVEQ